MGLATWALQYTPRVTIVDEAVLMELEASVRLFRGKRALRDRVVAAIEELGVAQIAWSATSLGALALARAHIENGFRKPHAELMDGLALETLTAAWPHLPTLARLGCQTLGDARRMPRAGISRRFGAGLVQALDRLYCEPLGAHRWVELPETFSASFELMARVEQAPAMLFGARRLLVQLCGWLAARHCGTTCFTLHWAHDAMRAKSAGTGGALTIRTAEPTRDVEHLCRLLAEHLAKVPLKAPVGDLRLDADEVTALAETSATLLPETVRAGEPMRLVLERMAVRFGPERVLYPMIREDYRPDAMCQWQTEPMPRQSKPLRTTQMPKPSCIVQPPLPLAERDHKPIYQGPLKLLLGPHRVEGAWWDIDAATDNELTVVRDYWVAQSDHAGVLWIFQDAARAWFLHGVFA